MKRDFVFRMTDSRFQALFLVTSLPHSADALSDLYLKRDDVQHFPLVVVGARRPAVASKIPQSTDHRDSR